jgi:DNA polymerase III subunit delta'
MPFSQKAAFDLLTEAHRSGRLAHAYLLAGPNGSGKKWIAQQLAALFLECPVDKVATHPDAHMVQPESKSRRILADQIRDLEHAIQRKPLIGRTKVAIIHEADRLQPQAANAFLKTLEEPPDGSLILLLSALPESILETVLSRCVEVPLYRQGQAETSPEEAVLLKALDECLLKPAQPGAAEAFRFTRAVQGVLAELREKISDEYEGTLKEETTRYKQTSESASWLDERAGQIKALTEAGALRERERVLQLVVAALSDALRSQHGYPAGHAVVQALAEKFSPTNLLHRLEAMETLRRRLAMGVQEALALESGFLEMIVSSKASQPTFLH